MNLTVFNEWINIHEQYMRIYLDIVVDKLDFLVKATYYGLETPYDLSDNNDILKTAMEDIMNCSLNEEAWMQATF